MKHAPAALLGDIAPPVRDGAAGAPVTELFLRDYLSVLDGVDDVVVGLEDVVGALLVNAGELPPRLFECRAAGLLVATRDEIRGLCGDFL